MSFFLKLINLQFNSSRRIQQQQIFAKKISFQFSSLFENYQDFQKALEIYRSKTYSTFRIKSNGFTSKKQNCSYVFARCNQVQSIRHTQI